MLKTNNVSNNFSSLHQTVYISLNDMLPYLPIKRSTVWKWVKTGNFPSPVKIHSLTRWRLDQIDAWLVNFTNQSIQTQQGI